ncbi:MAG: hypothetical protein GQ574_03690 [Crocinitomix sp.]|nr:hypothetical protein [Crocinitomix sp.]
MKKAKVRFYKLYVLILVIGVISSCESGITKEELQFVESNAWVRTDPSGFTTALFYFDSLREPPPFKLRGDTLHLFDGEFMGIVSFVDTVNQELVLRSLSAEETSNYKRTYRR